MARRTPSRPRPRSRSSQRPSPADRSARWAMGTPPTSRRTSTRPVDRSPPRDEEGSDRRWCLRHAVPEEWQAVRSMSDQPAPIVLAVDGNSLLHRSFHAQASSMYRTPDGVQGWAVRGLLSQLVAAVDRVCADVVVVGFDDRGNSSRKRRWPTYKAHRAPKPESLERQLDLAVDVLRDLGVL
ncbi:MAG TPA: hypothetical protein DEQ43_12175, partial [Nocardioides bacterium]|nr:hypothetical protein [Nocardioides sp.]